jgi:squalene monooxygenase
MEFDVVVVGGGIAGAVAALAFTKQHRRVLLLGKHSPYLFPFLLTFPCLNFNNLIERDLKEPNRIVGELINKEGVQALRSLGIKGQAQL